jgi:hypothetical protein
VEAIMELNVHEEKVKIELERMRRLMEEKESFSFVVHYVFARFLFILLSFI